MDPAQSVVPVLPLPPLPGAPALPQSVQPSPVASHPTPMQASPAQPHLAAQPLTIPPQMPTAIPQVSQATVHAAAQPLSSYAQAQVAAVVVPVQQSALPLSTAPLSAIQPSFPPSQQGAPTVLPAAIPQQVTVSQADQPMTYPFVRPPDGTIESLQNLPPNPATKIVSPVRCSKCHTQIRSTDYYCYNCGTPAQPVPLSISVLKQIGLYLGSTFLFPLGLIWGIRYLVQKDPKAKIVGAICLLITVVIGLLIVQTITAVTSALSGLFSSISSGNVDTRGLESILKMYSR